MSPHRNPNVRVWSLAKDYLEAAEMLLDQTRLQPAIILAGLANEIFLKSFLATQSSAGSVTTKRGHELTDLFSKIDPSDQQDILACSKEVDDTVDFQAQLNEFDVVFTQARYRYESGALAVAKSETIYFARHLCETVLHLGIKRGV
jgi:hypothetical protein